jgi:hypothetical protein
VDSDIILIKVDKCGRRCEICLLTVHFVLLVMLVLDLGKTLRELNFFGIVAVGFLPHN